MERTPIAHIVFPRPNKLRPVAEFVWDAVRAVREARDLDLEVLMPIPIVSARMASNWFRWAKGRVPWPDDIEAVLFALDPRPTLVRYLPLPSYSIESASVALAVHLIRKPRAERPRVIQGSFLDQGGFAAALAARTIGSVSIAVAHGTDVRAASGEISDSGRHRRALWTARKATRLITVSSWLEAAISRIGARAEVVRYAGWAKDFQEATWPSGPPIVLFVGKIGRAKGVDLLLEAFARLEARDAILELIGPRSDDLDLEREALRLGIADRFRVESEQPRSELATAFARSMCVVLPSRQEGFGCVLAEALLVGRPVVATDAGGMREIVSSRAGRLVPSEDPRALAQAIDDVLAASRRGEWRPTELRKEALPFTWETNGPQLIEMTRALAG